MISIVIPLYNESKIIDQLYKRVTAASSSWNENYEMVLVDDGSEDGSQERLRQLADENEHVRVVRFSRNFGHQAAITAGLSLVRGDAVVVMDGDLQDPPEAITWFLEKWRGGYDVVYAIRTQRKEGLLKKAAYHVFYRLQRALSDVPIPVDSGDFCLMDRKVVDTLNHLFPERIRFVRGLRAYSGFAQTGIPIERDTRAGGEPKYTFRTLFHLAMDGIIDFSTVPLRLASYFGIFRRVHVLSGRNLLYPTSYP